MARPEELKPVNHKFEPSFGNLESPCLKRNQETGPVMCLMVVRFPGLLEGLGHSQPQDCENKTNHPEGLEAVEPWGIGRGLW